MNSKDYCIRMLGKQISLSLRIITCYHLINHRQMLSTSCLFIKAKLINFGQAQNFSSFEYIQVVFNHYTYYPTYHEG